jgi:D-alanyl-D-alanine carboxypeptidase/D-alanyl-D-alanine-endopeptidase (penicillin-binding protein 4)
MVRPAFIFLLLFFVSTSSADAQTVSEKLARAWQRFESDSQLRAAVASIYVVDTKTNAVLFERNAHTGLATASTLKVITAATAYEVLGKDFRYTTSLALGRQPDKGALKGELYIIGSGDPTLGSWRWQSTGTDTVLANLAGAIKKQGIRSFGGLRIMTPGWSEEAIPDGWTWGDIGQYYGAGSTGITWHENQFDLTVQPGARIGDTVRPLYAKPDPMQTILPLATTAAAGSGDNSYLYLSTGATEWCRTGSRITLRGTLPAGKNTVVSGSLPDPAQTFSNDFQRKLKEQKIVQTAPGGLVPASPDTASLQVFHRLQSPPLDSIVYWFLRRSVNLYGEALLRSIALKNTGTASTSKGVDFVRSFWKERGIDPAELALRDGSGLSPENRVSTRAQVQVLQYARQQPWFGSYFSGFPEYNGMKIKSGTISNVKGFCGYHTSKEGVTYTFSILVNNYNGRTSTVVEKMYAILNELK